ncbi:MAG: aminotransferase class IV [bacterium]
MIAWFNGEYLPREDIHISPNDRGFLFGDALYDVIRAYDGHLLRIREHIARLEEGARAVNFPRTDFSELPGVAQELIHWNKLEKGSATVYIQVTRGVAPREHAFPPPETPMTLYVATDPVESDHEAQEKGIHTITIPDARWIRRDIKSTNRLANVLANQQAREAGAKEALFVQDETLLEGTHSSFFAVVDGVLCTHPSSERVLPGTTARIILDDLCPALGIPCKERPIRLDELPKISDALVAGTITEITPVVRIDDRMIGDGSPGPITRRLQTSFREFISNLSREGADR